jgi:hypothetical protein
MSASVENNITEPARQKPEPRKLSFGKKMLIAFILFFILAVTMKILFGSVFVFSDGDRTGYIYKFSKKGFVFKTHEGILKTGFVNLGNSVTPNEEWKFSVANEEVAKEIRNLDQRSMVKLHYKEYYTRLFWRGDTKYFVYRLEVMPPR